MAFGGIRTGTNDARRWGSGRAGRRVIRGAVASGYCRLGSLHSRPEGESCHRAISAGELSVRLAST